MQKFQSTIFFKCPECNEESTVDVEVPEFSWASFDRMSDLEAEGHVDVICPECEEAFDGYATCYSSGCEIKLEDFDVTYSGDVPMYSPEPDEWGDYEVPDHPHSIFLQSYNDMQSLLEQNIQADDEQILKRMIFSQSVSAMEAYLCDTLINTVFSCTESRKKMLNLCEPFRKKSLSLAEVANIETDLGGFLETQMKNTLKREIYHRIDGVSRLYQKSLEIKLIENDDDKEKLKIAIGHRHDCVHRNGFKKDQEERNEIFTAVYVEETMNLIKKIIDEIENKITAKTESMPF